MTVFVAKRSLQSAVFSDLFPKLAPLVRLGERGGALECGDPECLMDRVLRLGGRVLIKHRGTAFVSFTLLHVFGERRHS